MDSTWLRRRISKIRPIFCRLLTRSNASTIVTVMSGYDAVDGSHSLKYEGAEMAAFAERIKHIAPEDL